jgi:hypothetical protein
MATVVNDRDVLIMGTSPRFTPPTDRGMFISPTSAVFKVSADGSTASPASFTFTVTLLNMTGTVSFSFSSGMTPTVNGNVVTLAYTNMSAVSGTITATITIDGQLYTAIATVSKVADGATGQQGIRGNVDIAAVTTGSVWSDSEAVAALAAGGYGVPQVRDMVNLYKADRTFAVQKMYNGSAWVTVDYVWNGNVFVKGSILPESIDTRGLTIKDAAGNIILGSGTGLPTAYAAPGTLNSDLAPSISAAATTALWGGVSGRPQDAQNLIVRTQFEDGSAGQWGGSVVSVNGQAFTKALQVSGRDNFEVGNAFPVVAGETLYVEAWLDASTCNSDIGFGLQFNNSAGAVINWVYGVSRTQGQGWARVTGSLTVSANSVTATPWFQINNTTNFGTARGTGFRIARFQSGATVGAPFGTLVAGVAADSIASATTNFNASNDRNGSAVTAPTVLTDGTAVDHTIRTDGSADISFEWGWSGNEGDIDGFLVYVYQSSSNSAYSFGTTPAAETVYTVPANKRAFIIFGAAANLYTTFGVQAYRAVDKDVNPTGAVKSLLVKSTLAAENPYLPSANVAFAGNVTGTVGGIAAGNVNVWSAIGGTGKPDDNATVGATIGTNLFGQMNASNISTYIAAAAIGLALIDKASIGNLQALSATIGLLRTATSGERTEIGDNIIKMYAANNQKILHLGDSSK